MAKTSNKLTAKHLKDLAVGQTAYGSNLRATRNKSGVTFHACFTISGKRYLHRLGTDDKLNLTQATRKAAQYRATMERERELSRDGGAGSDMVLREAAPMYMKYLVSHGHGRTRFKDGHFRNHILPALGDMKIQKISSHEMQHFMEALLNKGLQRATVNRVKSTLDAFFKHAEAHGWVQQKPYRVRSLNETPKRKDRIPAQHQKALLAAARLPDQHPLIYLFLIIGLGVGMRHSEILNIRWENIDWESGNIWMQETKTGAREQPSTELMLEELRKLKQESGAETGYVFASEKSKSGRIDRMHKPFKRVCKAAGLSEDYSPHFLRHTFISEMIADGYSNDVVMHFTGHKTAAMISHYTHLRGTKAVAEVRRRRGRPNA